MLYFSRGKHHAGTAPTRHFRRHRNLYPRACVTAPSRFIPTKLDAFAQDVTRLAGDHVRLDEVECLLLGLQRAGHLSRPELIHLQAKYLREAKP
jgi:hypothetical protein